ncbi:MAG: peptide ABC transporter substrate-binding protein [Candidatus Yonathbacteria bacterium]|nr:peptide ABC transporter substrate-binding protein [Candidatus Yonathbacteria bacterium]
MASFDTITRPFRPVAAYIARVIESFSHTERVVFFAFVWIFGIGAIVSLIRLNEHYMVTVPAYGGSYTEGIVGTPRFINPLLAVSDADRDMTALIYAGLMRATPSGELRLDLASSYVVSDDGLIYTFTLKDDLVFHDGTPITADDVVFTVQKAQDGTLKSPKRANWDGISVEKEDATHVIFTLPHSYAPFLENTTLGIIPKHIWGDATTEEFSFSEYNNIPVGSGPYRVKDIKRDSSGIPAYYDLKPFKHYALGKPYISNLRVRFYQSEDELEAAFKKNEIEGMNAITPSLAKSLSKDGYRVEKAPLPRVFGVFFNQDKASIFADASVRKALDTATNKERIVNEVLSGYGTPLSGPIPPGSLGYQEPEKEPVLSPDERLAAARAILEKGGWSWKEQGDGTGQWEKKGKTGTMTLVFSLATTNVPELKAVADLIKEEWGALGVSVTIKVYETGDLNQLVIRPRDYDALLFGEIVGRDTDLFAFWHSSQRNDPGLNIAMYANITADKLLEASRTESDTTTREATYHKLATEIASDTPAVFLYAPDFIYALPDRIRGVGIGTVTTPSERFMNITDWHIETDTVWPIFLEKDSDR